MIFLPEVGDKMSGRKPKMSQFALDRCRSLVVSDASKPGSGYRVQLEILDTKERGEATLNTLFVRSEHDVQRVCWCRKG